MEAGPGRTHRGQKRRDDKPDRPEVNRESSLPAVMRLLKLLTGLAMLPLCVALARSLGWLAVEMASPAGRAQCAGLAIGFALWVFCYFTMPRPMWSYVLGHEMTHALWTFLFGGRASGMHVSDRGGHVQVTKTNVWIDLSPYFFPFYTMLVLAAYGITAHFVDVSVYRPFWMGLIGLTWGFHLTFTLSLLAVHQTDVQAHGRVFSYALIYAVNAFGVGLCVALLAGGRAFAGAWLGQLAGLTVETCGVVFEAARRGIEALR